MLARKLTRLSQSGNIAQKLLFHGGFLDWSDSVQTVDFSYPKANFYSHQNGVNFER